MSECYCGKKCNKTFCSISCARRFAWKNGSYGEKYRNKLSKIRKKFLKTHPHPRGMLGKKHSPKTISWLCKIRKGENHPRWIGGTSGYWRKKAHDLKTNIKVCEICNKKEAIDVHHKDGNYKNNSADNLIKLCKRCHRLQHPEIVVNMLKIRKREYGY